MKRIISLLLCLSMLLSMMPMSVFAAEGEETAPVTETAGPEESTAATETASVTEPAETTVPETTAETTVPETTVEATEPVETTLPEQTEETVPAETEETVPLETEETVPEETEELPAFETFTWVPNAELPSDEELFAGYAQQQFYGGIATFGTAGREKLDEPHQRIYDALAKQVKRIAAGERASALIAVGSDLGDVTYGDVTYPCTPEEETDLSGLTSLDLQLVLDVLLEDMPYELYWFDKTWGVGAVLFSEGGKRCWLFDFIVSADYSVTGEEGTTDVDTGKTGAASLAVANAQALVETLQDKSDYDKLASYADYIIDHVSYNTDAVYDPTTPYGNPWQLIWVFDNNTKTKVVCEGYSKAFQYLCDLSDFDNEILCYSVTGYLDPTLEYPGAHMWNILQVNGKNYLVDLTNCDTGFDLFLKGGEIARGAYYYEYVYVEEENAMYAYFRYDDTVYGTYVIDELVFAYDRDQTIALWGTEVTTLATEDLTEDNFPTVEESTTMTGEELTALLAGSASEITVSKALTIENSVTVPEGKTVIVTNPGSVTVANGGSLTVTGVIEFPATALTVQSGGSLTLKGKGHLGFYGVGALTLESGSSYAVLDEAEIYANQGTVLTGITKAEVCNSNMLLMSDYGLEAFLAECGAADYKTFYLNIGPNYIVSGNTTLPANVAVDNYGNTFTVANGGTLTVNGSWTVGMDAGVETVGGHIVVESGGTLILNGPMELLYGSTLTVESGAKLVNGSTLTVDSTSRLTNNGTIENAGTVDGTVGGSGTVTAPAMDGAWLIAQLENCTEVNYELTQRVVIDNSVVLPTFPVGVISISGNGSLTIKNGGNVTTENGIDASNGGILTVEAGGSLETTGWISAGAYGTIVNEGSCVADSYSMNYPGTITGIETSEINLFACAWDEASLIEALGFRGYKAHEVNIGDLKGDRNPAPVVLTKDVTIPADCTLVIGDEMGLGAVLEIADGVSLTNNSTISIWHGASLILGDGAAIAGSGTISSDGTIISCGTIENTVTGYGTVTEYMTQAQFRSLLAETDELTVTKPVTLTQSMVIPEGKHVFFEAPATLTVAEGAELTVEGSMDFPGSGLTVLSGGSLVLKGNSSLNFYGGSALTIEEGGSYAVLDEAEIYADMGTMLTGITKAEVCNSNFIENPEDNLQEVAEALGEGYKKFYLTLYTDYVVSEDMTLPDNVVLQQFGTTLTVTNGATLTVNGGWELGTEVQLYAVQQVGGHIVIEDGCLITNGPLELNYGSTLTVGRTASYIANGSFCVDANSSVANSGTVTVNGSMSQNGSWTGNSAEDLSTAPTTQAELEEQLKAGEATVFVTVPLTLNKDLTVPSDARLVITGDGSILIPDQRVLINHGRIEIRNSDSGTFGIVTAGGTVRNNGTIRNEGGMDLSDGVYEAGENALLLLIYQNQGEGTGTLSELLCDGNPGLYRQVTMVVEGWHEAQMRYVLELAAENQPKVLQINICGDMALNPDRYGTTLVLPEYATMYLADLGYGPAALTLPRGFTLTNNGTIEIGENGTLTVRSGAVLEGTQPVCREGGAYINENEKTLTGTMTTRKLTGPTRVTGTLEIPAGVTLTVSGRSAYLILEEGAEIVNNGTIAVEKGAALDVSGGSYSGSGTVTRLFHCDAAGTVTRAAIAGLDSALVKYIAETASGDAVIREAIGYVDALVEAGKIANPEARGFFTIRFAGETVLSADLELPAYSDPIITGIGSLTVPLGMTLTDHSGMRVAGTLIAEGQVTATGFPMMVDSEENLVNPENCTNFYYDDLALEAITVTADRDTAAIGETILVKVGSWMPEHARYFGDYEVSFDLEGFDGYGWNEDGDLQVYTDLERGACDVTVTLTATDEYGTVLYNSAEEPISASIQLHFIEKQLSLWVTESPDFWEDAETGICGLYPGGSLTYYANTTGQGGDVDSSITWPDYSAYSEYITTRVENGMLTVTAKSTMPGMTVIDIQPLTEDPAVVPYSEPLVLRPKAASVDILMDLQTVSGKTIQVDVNREGPIQVALAPMATPVDAYSDKLTSADAALVRWTSSDEEIAVVDEHTGVVTFTGEKTGRVKITLTTNFGVKKTTAVTFSAVKLAQDIAPSQTNAQRLIGGSSATYTVYDVADPAQKALKTSAVKWFLCDQNGDPVDSHPYASVTAAGKLTTKAVADEINVYLMAQVVGNEDIACLSEPVVVELYPAVSSAQIRVGTRPISGTLLYDTNVLGETYPLSWTAGPYLESVREVSWKSSAPKVASIDEDGLITVLKPGTAKFTLTVTALNNKKTTATVTMKFGVFTRGLDLSVLRPDEEEATSDLEYLTLYSGQSMTFRGENVPETVTTSGIQWSVDNKTYASISSAGVLKAKTVTAPVLVTVLAQSKDGSPNGIVEIPVLILPKQTSDGMEAMVLYTGDAADGYSFLTKTTRTVAPKETLQVFASDYADWNGDGDDFEIFAAEDVEWVSGKPSVATVTSDGLITAVAAGTAKITATDGFGRTAYFNLKVSKSSVDVEISLKKSGSTWAVASGKSLDLVGTVTYTDDSTDTKVNWSVSDPDLATVSATGKLTAAKNLTESATVTVWAYAKDGNPLAFDSVRVTLHPVTTAVEVFGTFGSYKDISNTTQKWDLTRQADTFTLSAKTFPEGAMGVTWKSSNTKIATVGTDGTVKCLKPGTVTVTATSADGSNKKATFKLTVCRSMTSLTLPETAIIGGGKSLKLTELEGFGIDEEATNKTLSWTLTYPNGTAVPKTVAAVSAKGVLTTRKLTAPLTLCVRATATDGSLCTDSCTVTVYPVTTKVTITNAPAELTLNGTWDLNVESTPASGANQFTWTTSNAKIATVHPQTGVVKARGVGTVTITATAADGSGKKASVKIKVVPVTFTVYVETMAGDVSSHTFTSSEPYLMDALLEERFIAGEYYYEELGGSLHTAFDIDVVNGIPDGQSYGFVWACRYYGTHFTNSFSGIDMGQLEIVPGGRYLFWPSQV